MTTAIPPICATCKNLNLLDPSPDNPMGYTCRAFPKGIPAEIIRNEHDHRQPFKGDGGVVYEPLRDGDPEWDPFKRASPSSETPGRTRSGS